MKVWNLYIRLFHWLFVALMAGMYITAENDWVDLHENLGYAMLFLILSRIVYGLIAKNHAAFKAFVHRPEVILDYVKNIMKGKHPRYIGHNPGGGMWVMVLLLAPILIIFSGMLTSAWNDYLGPLAFTADWVTYNMAEAMSDLHELGADLFIFAIIVHVVGVTVTSYFQKDNLVKSMFTGVKDLRDGDVDADYGK